MRCFLCCWLSFLASSLQAGKPIPIWPGLAPGETTSFTGEAMPPRAGEDPPVTRVVRITKPTMEHYPADRPNGTCVIILPGGGFSKVVPDKEGSEIAIALNQIGVTAFVLNYRTNDDPARPGWKRPLEDAERAISLVRHRASEWGLHADQIGLLGLSAGGQVAARLLSSDGTKAYHAVDDVDHIPHRPDFALLIYPWNIYDAKADRLVDGVHVRPDCPPTFLVHTHDDRSSSVGAALFYMGLRKQGISGELHVYGNGGHGYGLREVEGSLISTWPEFAAHWLEQRGLLQTSEQ
ncbi:MAG: alpha/beta hydrolase [Planctomycetaceae bacterium]|nr:alpha/beta hydrolase [Planctomycetaceae bacterium]